jgi:hypothetical protein
MFVSTLKWNLLVRDLIPSHEKWNFAQKLTSSLTSPAEHALKIPVVPRDEIWDQKYLFMRKGLLAVQE